MLRLVDISSIATDSIVFHTEELTTDDLVAYVVFDTSTGVAASPYALMDDYVGWRVQTVQTSTGDAVTLTIDNSHLYPSFSKTIPDYTELGIPLFSILTRVEYEILHNTLLRLDLVRRRMPNPGFILSSTNNIGQDGTVAMSGGFYKKMTVYEVMQIIMATIVEINCTSPRTNFWPIFQDIAADKSNNPLRSFHGFPFELIDLCTTGAIIRCLIALGLLEVDINFSTSDSGLQLTFDRVSHTKGWHDSLLQGYKEEKYKMKMNYANHYGVSVGTLPFAALGAWGTLVNNASAGGQLAMTTVMGLNIGGNVPM